MEQKPKQTTENFIKEIRRKTRRLFSSEQKLVDAIQDFVEYNNHECYHESLLNVTPSDVYYGRQEQILQKRALIKQQSLKR